MFILVFSLVTFGEWMTNMFITLKLMEKNNFEVFFNILKKMLVSKNKKKSLKAVFDLHIFITHWIQSSIYKQKKVGKSPWLS